MKGGYVTLNQSEVAAFLKKDGYRTYTLKGHTFIPLRSVGRNYCRGCGLVLLHNKITDWCVAKGCNHKDSPHYKAALKRLAGIKQ